MSNLMTDLGTKVGSEFKAHRIRIEALENGSTQTGDTVTLTGDVTGTATVAADGSITVTTTVVDNSHNHTISNVDGLQEVLDNKADLESPAFTGTPTAPTASEQTNTTQVATTEFVQSKKGHGTGANGDEVFFLNETTVNNSYTIPAGYNAGSFGPITMADNVEVIVSDSSSWTIV
jgi:hypothetical protein